MPTTRDKKLALVTGASRGIGAAIVSELERQGYDVIAVARSQCSARFQNMSIDLTRVEEINALISFIKSLGRPVALLVNNAGLAKSQEALGTESDLAIWDQLIKVNLDAAYKLSVGLSPTFQKANTRIIQIGSILSFKAVPDQPAYTVSKHALLGLTRSLALRFAAEDITVNMICPGWTNTEMAAQRSSELGMSFAELLSEVPLGRMIEPEEIAGIVSFLISPAAKNITGQAFVIDGGASL